MNFFGLKKGQDLEDRAAHVYAHQEFPGEPGGMQEQAQTVQRMQERITMQERICWVARTIYT